MCLFLHLYLRESLCEIRPMVTVLLTLEVKRLPTHEESGCFLRPGSGIRSVLDVHR